MKVDRHAKVGYSVPERSILWFVEIATGLVIADVGVAVDDRALGPQVGDRAFELVAGLCGILHRHRREEGEAVRVSADEARVQLV